MYSRSLRLHLDAPPAEAPQVVEARMHADAHAQLLGHHAQAVHGVDRRHEIRTATLADLMIFMSSASLPNIVGAPALRRYRR
jgi:hypothetical protein